MKQDAQEKCIELTGKFPEITGQRREELCAAFSEAIEWGRDDAKHTDPTMEDARNSK